MTDAELIARLREHATDWNGEPMPDLEPAKGDPTAGTLRKAAARIEALSADVERLREERNFLLARANSAGSVRFGGERWTGMSSNALVTVAFGGDDRMLPSDSSDLAACYRTVLRLPKHLRTDRVMAQLAEGERRVDDVAWAREATGWDAARAALASQGEG